MRRHRVFIIGELHVIQRTDLDDSRVVDQYVNPSVALDDLGNRPLRFVAAADVSDDGKYVSKWLPGADVVRGASELVFVPGDQGEPRALLGQLSRHHEAESPGSACNHHRLGPEVISPVPPPG